MAHVKYDLKGVIMLVNYIPEAWHATISLLVVAVMFFLFIKELYPTEVVALSGAAFFMLTGILPYDDALKVFSNPAPWTIGAMFILSGALVRTGVLTSLTNQVTTYGEKYPILVLLCLGLFVVLASAFMNNTPVVVIMIPIAMQMAKIFKVSASKMLIPLSYIAILGGICTLIGTSTNLLVDGVSRAQGLEPFTMFEVTPLAIILVCFGGGYLWLFGNRLLPSRNSMADLLRDKTTMRFFTEVMIPHNSALIGKLPLEVDEFKRDKGRVIDVLRGDKSLRRSIKTLKLLEGDRVVLKTAVTELLGLKKSKEVILADQISTREATTIEALIGPGCRLIGRRLGDMHLRRNFGVYLLALHRRNHNIGSQLDDIIVKIGDTLLLEGAPEDIHRMSSELDMVEISMPVARPYRRSKAPIVIIALAAVVILAAVGVAPIFSLAVLAVSAVLLLRCIGAEEAFEYVDGRLLVLIFSMLGIGSALQASGAVALIANFVAPYLHGLHPFFMVWAIYMLTSILTELVSNNAVAVVVTPIAISLGAVLGVDPRPLVVAVMVAASASFATPIGYQTNTLVYGPGGYSFTDFMRIGIPLNLMIGILASFLIPIFWPLT